MSVIGVISMLMVTITLVTMASGSSEPAISISTWRQLPKNATLMTFVTLAKTKSQCAAECWKFETPCVTFCKSVTSQDCYLAVEVTPAVNVLPLNAVVTCYRKGSRSVSPDGYKEYDGRYLKVYTASTSYTLANDQCTSDGGHLLYYKSLVWDTLAVQQLLQAVVINPYGYWVGATDAKSEGSFIWGDGSPVSAEVWGHSEPNNAYGSEDCAVVYAGSYRLNDVECGGLLPAFICQLDL